MNILVYSPFTSGGTCRLKIFEHLSKLGHEVSVVLPSLDRHSNFKLETTTQANGLNFIRPHQFKTNSLELSMIPYIAESLNKSIFLKNYDVVHILKPSPLTVMGYLQKHIHKVPLALDLDDLDSLVMEEEGHSKLRIKMVEMLEKYLPKYATHISVSSTALRDRLVNMGIPSKKISWISNGVDTSQFKRKRDYSHLKKKFKLKKYVVTYVGNLNKIYQVEPLIKAMKKVVRANKNISCLIVGDGKFKQYLIDLSLRQGLSKDIIFTGRVSSINEYLAISDITTAYFPDKPSIQYASNVKLFEYMASGSVPIVGAVGDLPFYVDYGNAGVVVETDNINKFAEAILELINDDNKRKKMAEYAQKHVKENYDWSVIANKVGLIYRDII